MTKQLGFTQALIRRAIEGAKSAGMNVCAVTVNLDGTITVHHGTQSTLASSSPPDHSTKRSKWADE